MDQDSHAQQQGQGDQPPTVPSETLEELKARHKKEKRELTAKVTALKKTATQGDKKKKKEVTAEIAQLEHAQSLQHDKEEKEWLGLYGNSTASSSTCQAADPASTAQEPEDEEDDFDVNDASAQSTLDIALLFRYEEGVHCVRKML